MSLNIPLMPDYVSIGAIGRAYSIFFPLYMIPRVMEVSLLFDSSSKILKNMDNNYLYYGTFIFTLITIFTIVFAVKDVIGSSVPKHGEGGDLFNSDI